MTFIVMQLYTFVNVFMGFYKYKNHKSNKILRAGCMYVWTRKQENFKWLIQIEFEVRISNKDETRKLSKVFCGGGGNNTKEKADEEFESVWRLGGGEAAQYFCQTAAGRT